MIGFVWLAFCLWLFWFSVCFAGTSLVFDLDLLFCYFGFVLLALGLLGYLFTMTGGLCVGFVIDGFGVDWYLCTYLVTGNLCLSLLYG